MRPPITHQLKTHPAPFDAVWHGFKTAEFRKDDRGFEIGDTLHLEEWDPATGMYTGRNMVRLITHKTTGDQFGIPAGFCMLSMEDGPGNLYRGNSVQHWHDKATAYRGCVAAVCDAFRSLGYNDGTDDLTTLPARLNAFAKELIASHCASLTEVTRLQELINNPELGSFLHGVRIESAHQREKWGEEHDHKKSPGDWSMLLDRIKGKQCQAVWDGDLDKLCHHLITMAAICFNYHRQVRAAIEKAKQTVPA